MIDFIKSKLRESAQIKLDVLNEKELLCTFEKIIGVLIKGFKNNNRMLICGNGGSAADAQHIAAELAGRFYKDRRPLPAVALHTNSSYLTAVANDYEYDEIFSRATESLGQKGDILLAISTSGNSRNVVRALEKAKSLGMITVGFTGKDGGTMAEHCDYLIKVPSGDVPRIQESHITLGHILCEALESALF